jgi:hypothetical protein
MRAHLRHLCLKNFFQWYNELLNPMSFDPCNRPLKIRESIETPTFKVGAHLGVCGFISSRTPTLPGTWNAIPMIHSWPTPLQALALVISPRLGLQHFMPRYLWRPYIIMNGTWQPIHYNISWFFIGWYTFAQDTWVK